MQLGESLQGKPLTLSIGAWMLASHPQRSQWRYDQEFDMVHSAILGASDTARDPLALPCVPTPSQHRSDPRGEIKDSAPEEDKAVAPVIKLFTDYDEALKTKLPRDMFELVDNASDADFLLLVANVKDFLSIPPRQRISQFPYEGGFVRKDLLPLTVRRYCFRRDGSDDKRQVEPEWWLPCYDTSTEFHLLYNDFLYRLRTGQSNDWIVKPAQGTRAQGHRVVFGTDDASDLANACSPFDNSGDKVAQLLVSRPLLVHGKKFDLRVIVVVRSFDPFDAYVHNFFYARLANKAYDASRLDDEEVALTVSAYDVDTAKAQRQERRTRDELRAAFLRRYFDVELGPEGLLSGSDAEYKEGLAWWDQTVSRVHAMLRELFSGVAPSIGHWPRSRAYYGVDVIFDASDPSYITSKGVTIPTPMPKLVEVNYMGDWHGIEGALEGHPKHAKTTFDEEFDLFSYEQWKLQLLTALCTNTELDEKTFTKL
jgi:hypothetical protein